MVNKATQVKTETGITTKTSLIVGVVSSFCVAISFLAMIIHLVDKMFFLLK